MELLQLPDITDVPLSYLTLAAIVSATLVMIRLIIVKRDELRIKSQQVQAQAERDKQSFGAVERQYTQMAETNRLTAESIHATNQVAKAVEQNTTAVKDSLRDLHDAMRDGFKRTVTLGEENNRAIAHTQTVQERRLLEIHVMLDRLTETVNRQYSALSDSINVRNSGDSQITASIHAKINEVHDTLNNVSDALRRLAVLVDMTGKSQSETQQISRAAIRAELDDLLHNAKLNTEEHKGDEGYGN